MKKIIPAPKGLISHKDAVARSYFLKFSLTLCASSEVYEDHLQLHSTRLRY